MNRSGYNAIAKDWDAARSSLSPYELLTDFAYWLFLTDLGVDRRYAHNGIGRRLVEATHELAGGERAIVMFTNVNEDAIAFYEKLGMKASSDIFAKWNIEWTAFEVGKDPLP